MSLTFDELRAANVERCESVWHPISDWSPTDWMTAVAGEAGEAANLVKKLRRIESAGVDHLSNRGLPEHDEIVANIGLELADTVTYLDLLAARLGINLGEAVRCKFNIVSHRVNSEVRL